MLLADNLLILELQQLAFFFKVSDLLAKTPLQEINLSFKHLYLFVLFKLLLREFFNSHAPVLEFPLAILVFGLNLLNLVLKISVLLFLHLRFILQTLILNLNVALDFRYVFLCLRLSLLLVLFKLLKVMRIDPLLLTLNVLCTLSFNLSQLVKEHFKSVLFIFDLCLLLLEVVVVEVDVLLLLRHLLDLHGLLCESKFPLFVGIFLILIEGVPNAFLLALRLFFLALEELLLTVNHLVLLVDLLLKRTRDFHHVLVVLVDVLLHLLDVRDPVAVTQFSFSLTSSHSG